MLRTRRPVRLALASLEARDNPAGTVTATFAAGALTLAGDAEANALTVAQRPDGTLRLTGSDGTQVRLNGAPPATEVFLPSPLTGAVTARLGAGNDSLEVLSADLPGALRVNGGPGDNTVAFPGGIGVRGPLTITHGAGFDTTRLFGEVTVTGGLSIASGPGGSLVDGDASTALQVTGGLRIAGGPGDDTVALGDAARITAGSIAVSAGPGANVTDIGPVGPLTVTRGVRVVGGPNADTIRLEGESVSIGDGLAVHLAGGANSTTVLPGAGGLSVGGPVVVTGGAGSDDTALGAQTSPTSIGGVLVAVGAGGGSHTVQGSELTVEGALRVLAGAGTDSVTVRSLSGDGAIGGDLVANLGPGDGQTVTVAAVTNLTTLDVGGSLRVTAAGATPAGGDTITLLRVSVRGATAVTTGAGGDTVFVNDSAFRAFALRTGAGADVVEIERADSAGTTRFVGPVRVLTGDGNDGVRVGDNKAGVAQAVFGAASLWDGGPGDADGLVLTTTGNLFITADPVTIRGFESEA